MVKDEFRTGLLMLLGAALFALLALSRLAPPASKSSDAPAAEFSAARAMGHLYAIAQRPHEMGSPEHERVRDYLVGELTKLGVTPEVQKAEAATVRSTGAYAGTVENVLARLPGTQNQKAVLLAAHYDSVPTGPGANDNGVGVAALLETLRALKAGPPLKNDVILLFTDGEETGLLGAQAFVTQHPWAKEVGVVFNFDARGDGGPSMMFETSNGNGALIGEFARATPYPSANSLSADIYRILPNDTDMSIFKEAGLPGLNFAYFEGLPDYHTQLDSVAHVNAQSLQHHGTQALTLARRFGNGAGGAARAGNAVYFDTLGAALIHYPVSWIVPLAVVVVIAFVAVIVFGLRRRRLTVKGILAGAALGLLSVVTSAAAVWGAWTLVRMLHPAYRRMTFGEPYNSGLYVYAFAALTFAVVTAFVALFRGRVGAENLLVGGLFWWILLLVLSILYVPGGSYLFTWPVLFTLLGVGVRFAAEPEGGTLPGQTAFVLVLCAAPGLLLLTPLVYQLSLALTVNLAWVAAVLLALLLLLLISHLGLATSRRRWLLPFAALLVSAGFIAAAGRTADFGLERPKPFHLIYGLDADKNEAVWATADDRPEGWASQFFNASAQWRPLDAFYQHLQRPFLVSSAPAAALAPPAATLLEESREGERRVLRLRVDAQATAVIIYANAPASRILSVKLSGKEIASSDAMAQKLYAKGLHLRYYAPQPGGVELRLELEGQSPVNLRAVTVSNGLPQGPGLAPGEPPVDMIPAPYLFSNSTMVSKQFTF
ncbi:MAG: M20/M25/M40 family metallo-hydrolase [Acidobacteria bacterium]|nr:M20/M25/M40 family metallo-hydrolase [Acidobacteriota bacterium]